MGWPFRKKKSVSPVGRSAPIPRNWQIVAQHLKELTCAYNVCVANNYQYAVVGSVKLPPGYNSTSTSVLLEIPYDYPQSPPGIGNYKIYVEPSLRFYGRVLRDVHPQIPPPYPIPGCGPWAYWCYQDIRWNPVRDNLIRFMEMFRGDLTNPPVV
jgi:hypothetical protein